MMLKITAKHLLSRPVSSFLTLFAISSALTLLGTFWTLVENLERVKFQSARSEGEGVPSLTVFADARLSAKEVDSLRTKLLEDKGFAAAEIVSPAEAMKSLEQQFGEALSKVFGDEALPVTLKLRFAKSSMNRDELVSLLNKVRSVPGVLDVDDSLTAAPLAASSATGRIFSWAAALLVVVFLIVALLVSHLIRLAFETLRPEIETMKVIGATNRWILLPLLADGFFLGLAGAVIALAAVLVFVQIILPKFAHFLLPKGAVIVGLSVSSAMSIIGLAIFASLLGALFTWPLVKRPAQEV